MSNCFVENALFGYNGRPDPVHLDENVADNWRMTEQECDVFIEKPAKTKAYYSAIPKAAE